MTPRRLVLIGGSAGSGKTTVAQTLAAELGAGWLQLDTVWLALKAAAGAGSAAYDCSTSTAGCAAVARATRRCSLPTSRRRRPSAGCSRRRRVRAGGRTQTLVVRRGSGCCRRSWPGLSWPDTEVGRLPAHRDVDGVATALRHGSRGRAREERHLRMNRRICQYGDWVPEQARARLPRDRPAAVRDVADRASGPPSPSDPRPGQVSSSTWPWRLGVGSSRLGRLEARCPG